MRNLLILAVAAVALISACDLFDTTVAINQADNERKLKELQWALLIPSVSPPATPVSAQPPDTHTESEVASNTPGDEPAITGHEDETHGTPSHEPAPVAAAPQHEAAADGHGDTAVMPVEHDPSKAVPTTVAVMAVVDSFTLLPAGEDEDPTERAKKLDLAQRRERVVRQQLQNVLVANSMITVVQPNESQIAAARAEIAATNSAALSNTMLPGLAETLGVQHVVTALCDLEGEEVNVVAQHAPDGTIVFQDTMIGWEVVLAVAKGAATEEEAAQ